MSFYRSASGLWLPGDVAPRRKHVHVVHLVREVLRRGDVIIEDNELNIANILHDEGELAILSAYFDTDYAGYGAPPANLYIGLDARVSLGEGDTLSNLTNEPVGNGYARKSVSTSAGFTLSQPGAYYKATSAVVTQTASGGTIGPVTDLFLTTAASGAVGKLIASLALSVSRTLQDGESLDHSIAIGLSE